MEQHSTINTQDIKHNDADDGSGTVDGPVLYVASSRANDPPAGSPVMVTREIPLGELSCRNSLGLLPETPESASLLGNGEVTDANRVFPIPNASSVSGSA